MEQVIKSFQASQRKASSGTSSIKGRSGAGILVVSKRKAFSDQTMRYAVNVAERIGGTILAASVNTLPDYYEEDEQGRSAFRQVFTARSKSSAGRFQAMAYEWGVGFEHVNRTGPVDQAVSKIFRDTVHIDLVLLEPDIPRDKIAAVIPVPVFSLTPKASRRGAGAAASTSHKGRHSETKGVVQMPMKRKRQARKKAVLFGVMAVVLYAAVFTQAALIMKYSTRGGLYMLLPVTTVFLFSYVHGSFTSNFWSALGIEASKKTTQKTVVKPARERKPQRPRARLLA